MKEGVEDVEEKEEEERGTRRRRKRRFHLKGIVTFLKVLLTIFFREIIFHYDKDKRKYSTNL